MKKVDFNLKNGHVESIRTLTGPEELTFVVRGMTLSTSRGKSLAKGAPLAQSPRSQGGDLHASCAGKVSKVSYDYLTLKVDGDDCVDPVDVASITDMKELSRALRALGMDLEKFRKAELLVVNGLNPEPEITVSEALLEHEVSCVNLGLEWARKLIGPKKCVLAVRQGASFPLTGCEQKGVRARYPFTLDPFVVKAVTGKENPHKVAVLDVPTLWALGRVVETGLPLMETVATIKGQVYRLPLGAQIQWVLEQVGLSVEDGDMVLLGGPMRGVSAYSLTQGLAKTDHGLGVVTAAELNAAPVQNVPCINCGECVLRCPARLQPNLITRNIEYNRFDEAAKLGLAICTECGLCTYYCTARRPLLHLIRFAKKELKLKR